MASPISVGLFLSLRLTHSSRDSPKGVEAAQVFSVTSGGQEDGKLDTWIFSLLLYQESICIVPCSIQFQWQVDWTPAKAR